MDQAYDRLKELQRTIPEYDGKLHSVKNNIDELHNFLFNDVESCVGKNSEDISKTISTVASVYTPHANCDRKSCCDDSDSDMSYNNDSSEEMQISDDIVNNSVLPITCFDNVNNLDTNVNCVNEVPAKPKGHVVPNNDIKNLSRTERPVIGPLPATEKVTTNNETVTRKKSSKKSKSSNAKDLTCEKAESVKNANHTPVVELKNKPALNSQSDLSNKPETETNAKNETNLETETNGSKLFWKPSESTNEEDGCIVMEEPTPNASVEYLKNPPKDNFVKQRKRSRKNSGNSEGPTKKSQSNPHPIAVKNKYEALSDKIETDNKNVLDNAVPQTPPPNNAPKNGRLSCYVKKAQRYA
ncbi:hypothetical protein AVEN_96386-1 [Araneus ventricosus]|uniref:Uncharacterized protein n=1 Tax=Araneus ventricosus TaxID=182803 RepID=A0A4Y2CX89_ARAVE|nr:hypothetical protein AVEN_96386-1 [Araneus ventricosus]